MTTNENLLDQQAVDPSFSGRFDPYSGKPESMEWGLGITPLTPEQLSGSFSGALASLRLPELNLSADGTYSFNVALNSGAISNAAMNIRSGSTAIASASGGSGVIGSDLSFTAGNWSSVTTNKNILAAIADPSLSGQFDPYSGKPGSVEWGLGITPLTPEQISGTFSGSLPGGTVSIYSIGEISDYAPLYSFTVELNSKAISNASMSFSDAQNQLVLSQGTGSITQNLSFDVNNWGNFSTTFSVPEHTNAQGSSLSGQFNAYTGKPGNLYWSMQVNVPTTP